MLRHTCTNTGQIVSTALESESSQQAAVYTSLKYIHIHPRNPASQSVGHPVSQLVTRSVSWSPGQLVGQSVSQSVSWSVSYHFLMITHAISAIYKLYSR